MSTAPAPVPPLTRTPARRAISFEGTAPWAALAIAAMWVVVLAVGLWGGDIYSSSAGGNISKVPTAVVVAGCALIGTWVIAKRAFAASSEDLGQLRAAVEDERRAREALEQRVEALSRRDG